MPQDYILSDFSGGINPSQAVDKLTDREALQAQNVRLDDFGNLASAFPSSLQAKNITDTSSNSNVHSIYVDQTIGSVAVSGSDFFAGVALNGLTVRHVGLDASKMKCSIASAPARIYFDDGSGNAWAYDPTLSVPVTVDWAPPQAGAGATTTATAGTVGTIARTGANGWAGASNATGTSAFATVSLSTGTPTSNWLKANGFGFSLSTNTLQGLQMTCNAKLSGIESTGYVTVQATLLRNGVAVGITQSATIFQNTLLQLPFGNSTYLWGSGLNASDVNSSTFGVQIAAVLSANAVISPVTLSLNDVAITAYQVGSGFVAGTAIGSGSLAGTYTYGVTFTAQDGAESDISSPSLPIALSSGMGTLTSLPLGDARTTGRNIYRIGGALTSFYLVGSVSDNVSTTFLDSQSDLAALTEGVILPGNVAGTSPNTRLGQQSVKYPCFHLERLFWANANSNTLVWSAIDNAFAYPAVNELPIGDSKPITGILSKWSTLIIVKTDSVWLLSGTDESNFTVTRSESQVGSNQPFTIAQMPNGVVFASTSGLWIFNGATSVKLTSKLDLLFRGQARNGIGPIETLVASVYANHCAVATATEYWFACATSGSLSNNLLFVINLLNGTIVTRSIDLLSMTADASTEFIYGGLANGQIVRLDDYSAFTDSQGAFMFNYQTKYTDCNSRGSNIQIWGVEVYGNLGGQTLTPTVSYDQGANSETLSPITNTNLTRIQRSCEAANARKAQSVSVTLNGSLTGGPVEISHIKIIYDVLQSRARTGQ